jgi:hypothetical protein
VSIPLPSEQERLFRIFFPFAANRAAIVACEGIRFVYYTRAETATSILKNAQIWIRKSMCMNDFMEVRYGLERLNDALGTGVGARFKSVLDRLFEGLQAEMQKLLFDCMWHLQTDTYLTCFSEHKRGASSSSSEGSDRDLS